MNMEATNSAGGAAVRTGLRWPHVAMIIIVTIAVTAGITYWLLSQYLFLTEFKPVRLKPREEQVLNRKLQAIGIEVQSDTPAAIRHWSRNPTARPVRVGK
jgi:hypothetical protein